MTVREIAKYLGVHEMTIYRLAKRKEIPCFKLGGRWRAHKERLDKVIMGIK